MSPVQALPNLLTCLGSDFPFSLLLSSRYCHQESACVTIFVSEHSRSAKAVGVNRMETTQQTASRRPLWEPGRIAREISEGAIYRHIEEAAAGSWAGIPGLLDKVVGALQHPKPLDICMPVLNAVLAAQYYELFAALCLPRTLAVYEPCVGASNPVIIAAEAYSSGDAHYLTINLNRKLREELQQK